MVLHKTKSSGISRASRGRLVLTPTFIIAKNFNLSTIALVASSVVARAFSFLARSLYLLKGPGTLIYQATPGVTTWAGIRQDIGGVGYSLPVSAKNSWGGGGVASIARHYRDLIALTFLGTIHAQSKNSSEALIW